MTLLRLCALLSLVVPLAACSDGATYPTSPTPAAPAPPTYTLSGTVSEMTSAGPVPIERVQVIDLSTNRTTISNSDGFYSIGQLPATNRSIQLIKDGYVTATRSVTISGDTRLDIELDQVPNYTLSGTVYEMTAAGPVPVEGVTIYCDSCGSPVGHTFVNTNADGFYSLAWAMAGIHPLYVTKPGYAIVDPSGMLRDSFGRIRALVRGDTRFDIEIGRP